MVFCHSLQTWAGGDWTQEGDAAYAIKKTQLTAICCRAAVLPWRDGLYTYRHHNNVLTVIAEARKNTVVPVDHLYHRGAAKESENDELTVAWKENVGNAHELTFFTSERCEGGVKGNRGLPWEGAGEVHGFPTNVWLLRRPRRNIGPAV